MMLLLCLLVAAPTRAKVPSGTDTRLLQPLTIDQDPIVGYTGPNGEYVCGRTSTWDFAGETRPPTVPCTSHRDCVGSEPQGVRQGWAPCCHTYHCVCGSTQALFSPTSLTCAPLMCTTNEECAPGCCGPSGTCTFDNVQPMCTTDEGCGKSDKKGKAECLNGMCYTRNEFGFIRAQRNGDSVIETCPPVVITTSPPDTSLQQNATEAPEVCIETGFACDSAGPSCCGEGSLCVAGTCLANKKNPDTSKEDDDKLHNDETERGGVGRRRRRLKGV